MPWGFAELLAVILSVMFRFDFDRVIRLESLAMLGIDGSIRGLLRRFTRAGEGCGSAASTPDGNGMPPEDTFCEMFGRP
jgi:hypothetical protein